MLHNYKTTEEREAPLPQQQKEKDYRVVAPQMMMDKEKNIAVFPGDTELRELAEICGIRQLFWQCSSK